jgi:anti-sigma B factor antagonist
VPPEPFNVEVTVRDGRAVVAPSGELDLATAGELEERIAQVQGDGASEVVLDLRGLRFIDSTGVRLLARAHAASRDGGPAFSIVEGEAPVMRVLELTGIAEFLQRADLDG